MTLKEKVMEVQPECIDSGCVGGVQKCPGDYPYLNEPEMHCRNCTEDDCEDCWNKPFVDKSDNTEQVNHPEQNEIEKNVCHPSHYSQDGRRECIEEMRVVFGDEAVREWCILTAYKYMYRAGNKSGNSEEQDRAKMAWYLDYAEKMGGKK